MFRVDTAHITEILPDPDPAGTPGYFTKGNPAEGIPATTPGQDWFNMVQEELANVVETYLGPETLDKEDRTQLVQAINAKIAALNLGTAAYRNIGVAATQVPEVLALTGKLDPAIIPATGTDLLRKQLMLNGLMDTMSDGAPTVMMEAFIDSLDDVSRIDAGRSDGYTHDAAGDYIHNPGVATQNYVSSSGDWNGEVGTWTFGGQSIIGAYLGHGISKAMQRNDVISGDFSIEWHHPTGGGNNEITGVYDATGVGTFDGNVYGGDILRNAGAGITSFGIQRYNGDPYYNGLLHDGNHTFGVLPETLENKTVRLERVGTEVKLYVDDVLRHTYVTAFGGDVKMLVSGDDLETSAWDYINLATTGVPDVFDVIWNPETAFAEPTTGYVLAIIEPPAGVIYGTDITCSLSKNDGTDWDAVAIEKVGDTDEGYDVVFGSVLLSGAGTELNQRWQMPTGKHCKIHGIITDAE